MSASSKPPVVILCGGQGTRLGEDTERIPKPMVTIGGEPILMHIMRRYAAYGHTHFVLCLGWKGEAIRDWFLNYDLRRRNVRVVLSDPPQTGFLDGGEVLDWTVDLIDTGRQTQTGERLRRAAAHIEAPTVMMTYGDGLADVDLAGLLDFHTQSGRLATVTGVHPPTRFGELELDGDRVTRFAEKPQVGEGIINGGFFVLQREVLTSLPEDPECRFEGTPLERLATDGQLGVWRHEGFWRPMDTRRDRELLEGMWAQNVRPWVAP